MEPLATLIAYICLIPAAGLGFGAGWTGSAALDGDGKGVAIGLPIVWTCGAVLAVLAMLNAAALT